MTIGEIVRLYWDDGLIYLVILSGIIQISPLKLNPWTWLAKTIGNAVNADIMKQTQENAKKITALEGLIQENYIKELRSKILSFDDDVIRFKGKFSQARYEQMLRDIEVYNQYCIDHPSFKNGVTEPAAKRIQAKYEELKNLGVFQIEDEDINDKK